MSGSQTVRKNAEAADDMIRQLAANAQQQAEPTGSNVEPLPVPADDGADGQSTPEPVGQTPNDNEIPAPAPATEDFEARLRAAEEKAEKAEQRWKSLDGIVRSKDKQLEQYQELLAKMAEAPPKDESPAEPQAPVYAQEDVDAFGEDMLDAMARVASRTSGSEVDALRKQVADLQDKLSGVDQRAAVSAKDTFETNLERLSPNWRELDADDAFIEWLGQSKTRHALFASAVNEYDAEATAELFNLYREITGTTQRQADDAAARRQAELEAQVSPGKTSKSAPTPKIPTSEKMWTRSEIARVYTNKKQYSKEDFDKLEREISDAMKAGRVDYSS